MKVILFYKYVDIENPEKFREEHLRYCNELGIKGRILIAKEGINGSVSGSEEQVEKYKNNLRNDERFSDVEFKEEQCIMHPFNKMKIKIKNELVRFEQNVDLNNAGIHLTPEEFLEMSEKKEVVILDARNNYESSVGKFKGAITPDINTFREFPKIVEQLRDMKDKKILMYCTGGIRCEKASAFLKKNGFNDVYQLHGGILNFGKHFPDTIWDGKCFVFDKRLLSDMNSENKVITNCETCSIECDLIKNCRNKDCDKFTITCLDCEKEYAGCCSEECYGKMFG